MRTRTDRALGRGYIHAVVGDENHAAQFLFFGRDHLPEGFSLKAADGQRKARLVCNLEEWIRPEMVRDARGSIGNERTLEERTIPITCVDLTIQTAEDLDVLIRSENDQIAVRVDIRGPGHGSIGMEGTFGWDSSATRYPQRPVLPEEPSRPRRGKVIEIRHET